MYDEAETLDCKAERCDKPARTKGYCDTHYQNTRRNNGVLVQRFCFLCNKELRSNANYDVCASCRKHDIKSVPAEMKPKRTEKNRETERAGHLRRNYGITLEDYDRLFKAQGGKCAVCDRSFKTSLHVDHDHKTGEVRGLLCNNCNRRVVGRLTAEQAKRIADYLEHPPALPVIGKRISPVTRSKRRRSRK